VCQRLGVEFLPDVVVGPPRRRATAVGVYRHYRTIPLVDDGAAGVAPLPVQEEGNGKDDDDE